MGEILNRICEGHGREGDIELLEDLSQTMVDLSLCGLGNTAPNPVLSTLRYFRNEYEAHILDKRCPAKFCKGLISYSILPDRCTGCGACLKTCPVDAISGEKKQPHQLDVARCVNCGACYEACKFDAVVIQ